MSLTIKTFIFSILALCYVTTLSAQTKPKEGDGTAANPYMIGDASELKWFRDQVNRGRRSICAELKSNIFLNNEQWTPIGEYGDEYAYRDATFDGKGHTIYGLDAQTTSPHENDCVGLFGHTKGVQIKNVRVSGSATGVGCVGMIVGFATNSETREGEITNCSVNGYVYSSGDFAGGIVGRSEVVIAMCSNYADVQGEGKGYAGGIAGAADAASIRECMNDGRINITGKMKAAGGVAGRFGGDIIADCANVNNISHHPCEAGDSSSIGGVAGVLRGEEKTQIVHLERCFNYGYLAGNAYIAHIIGNINKASATSEKCFFNADAWICRYTFDAEGFMSETEYKGQAADGDSTGDGGNDIEAAIKAFNTSTKSLTPEEIAEAGRNVTLGTAWGFALCYDKYPVLAICERTGGLATAHDINFDIDGHCSCCGATDVGNPLLAKDGYYEISTRRELIWLRNMVNGGYTNMKCRLMADINISDAEGNSWNPIGNVYNRMFTNSIFDGNGHTISGLYINSPNTTAAIGLFGFVSSSTIKNLTVCGSVTGNSNVGMLAGYAEKSYISNCIIGNADEAETEVTSSVQGKHYVGGIVGTTSTSGTIDRCVNYASVTAIVNGAFAFGGVAGSVSYTDIQACANYGDIRPAQGNSLTDAGGIAGRVSGSSDFTNNVNWADVCASSNVGAMIGNQTSTYQSTAISRCWNEGTLQATDAEGNVAVFVGNSKSTKLFLSSCCYSSASILDADGSVIEIGDGNLMHNIKGLDYAEENARQAHAYDSSTDLASGYVAYHLGKPWGQQIGTDPYPLIGGTTVYQIGQTYHNQPSIKGDVNKDGYVNISDVIMLVNMVTEKTPANTASDINGDAITDIADVAALISMVRE
ncbi:MAG: dockerin type I repeat-containing protein [Bacteroidaceae bacterium]|nr:dockerin type I repeat-containing protein [Bacteroidaceae bacterium]